MHTARQVSHARTSHVPRRAARELLNRSTLKNVISPRAFGALSQPALRVVAGGRRLCRRTAQLARVPCRLWRRGRQPAGAAADGAEQPRPVVPRVRLVVRRRVHQQAYLARHAQARPRAPNRGRNRRTRGRSLPCVLHGGSLPCVLHGGSLHGRLPAQSAACRQPAAIAALRPGALPAPPPPAPQKRR
eukprot:6077045-Prymnesium_polylepis.1